MFCERPPKSVAVYVHLFLVRLFCATISDTTEASTSKLPVFQDVCVCVRARISHKNSSMELAVI